MMRIVRGTLPEINIGVSHMIKNNIILLFIFFSILFLIPSSAARGLPTSDAEPSHQAEIESRLDLGHPDVMRTAVTMARNYPGEFSVNQVSAVYRHLVEEKAWNYFNDPSFQEYYKYANQTLEDGYRAGTEAVGDCDDFAILMASLVESLHGTARIIFAHDEQTDEDHAYAQLYVGENGDPIVDKIENFIKDEWGVPSVPGLGGSDDNSLWLNLDYNATYPGGFVFGGEMADTEVAWTSGNRTSPKIVPLIDSMDSLASWEVVKDGIGSNISIKNALSKTGKSIEISYDLMEGGFVGISRDVDPKVLAELEGINFTYLMSGRPANLMLVLDDGNSSGYSRSWNLFGNPKGDRPKWSHLEGYYDDFQRMNPVNADSSQERINRSNVRKIKFIISRITDEGYISCNGSIALDQIKGVMRIPKDSIWNQVKGERERALAVQLASESELALSSSGRFREGIKLAVESLTHQKTFEGELALRRGLLRLPCLMASIKHEGPVGYIAFSPDGSRIATANWDNTARILNITTSKELRLQHDKLVSFVAFSPDGKKLATGGWDNCARIWDAFTGKELANLEHKDYVRTVAFSPDGTKIVTASNDNTAGVWDASNGSKLATLKHDDNVNSAAFSPNGSNIVTASDDKTARTWNASSGKEMARMSCNWSVSTAAFSPDGDRIATACYNTMQIWSIATQKELVRSKHRFLISSLAFSPDGTRVGTASHDKTARIWEASSGKEMARFKHGGLVNSIVFSSDGTKIATACYDRSATIWDVFSEKELIKIEQDDIVNFAAFSPDGTRIATGGYDYYAHVFDIASGMKPPTLENNDLVSAVAFSPDGTRIATACWDNTATIWNVSTGKEMARMKHNDIVSSLAFSPDGTRIVTASWDHTARVWDTVTGSGIAKKMEHDDIVRSVAFSPDGNRIATASDDKTVRVWDASTGKEKLVLEHDDRVYDVIFSPNGTRIVSISDFTPHIWDASSGKELGRLEQGVEHISFNSNGTIIATAIWDGSVRIRDAYSLKELSRLENDGQVLEMDFCADGTEIATAGYDKTARVWDVLTGKEITRLEHDSSVYSIEFSPDDAQIVSADDDGNVRIWYPNSKDLIGEACRRMRCNLTSDEWCSKYCQGC
jgi:WD40 repeat protein